MDEYLRERFKKARLSAGVEGAPVDYQMSIAERIAKARQRAAQPVAKTPAWKPSADGDGKTTEDRLFNSYLSYLDQSKAGVGRSAEDLYKDYRKGVDDYYAAYDTEAAQKRVDELTEENHPLRANVVKTGRSRASAAEKKAARKEANAVVEQNRAEAENLLNDIERANSVVADRNAEAAAKKLKVENPDAYEAVRNLAENRYRTRASSYNGLYLFDDINPGEETKRLKDMGYTDEQINSYVDQFSRIVNREQYEAESEKLNQLMDSGWLGRVAADATRRLGGIPAGITGGVDLTVQRLSGKPIDWYTPGINEQRYSSDIVQGLSQRIEDRSGKVASFLYQTGISMTDSLAIAGMTALGVPAWLGTAALGTVAGTQAAIDAHERGLSDRQAFSTGLVAGIAEAAFESISLDKLLKPGAIDAATLGGRISQVFRNFGKQSFTEGSEEFFTDIANAITDSWINGGQSEFNTNVQKYILSGESEEDARKHALSDFAVQVGTSFAGGALSGGIMGGGSTFVSSSQTNKAYAQQYTGDKLTQTIDKTLENDPNNRYAQRAKTRTEQGKRVSGATIRNMVESNNRVVEGRDLGKVTDAVEQRLKDLGESAERAKQLAPLIANKWAGDNENAWREKSGLPETSRFKLSKADTDLLASSKYVDRVINELNDTEQKTANAWVSDVSTERLATGETVRKEVAQMWTRIYDALANENVVTAEDTEELERQFGKAGAEAFKSGKTADVDNAVYYHAFNTAYLYGSTGATLEQAKASIGDTVNDAVISAAYEVGKSRAEYQLNQRMGEIRKTLTGERNRKPGKVKLNVEMSGLTPIQRSSVDVIMRIATMTGINVEVFESKTDNKGKFLGENGSYDPTTNTIRVDINAGRQSLTDSLAPVMLRTMSHEMTHYIQHNAPDAYEELKQFVSKHLIGKGTNLEQLAQEKIMAAEMDGKDMTPDQAIDEVVADACENMLQNTTAIDTLARENYSLFRKVYDFIKRFHNALKRAFSGSGYEHKEAKAMLDKADELQKLWDAALLKAVENQQRAAEGRDAVDMVSNGQTVGVEDDNGHAQLSMRTYDEGGREQLTKFLNKQVKNNSITREEANEMLAQMETYYKICKEFEDKYGLFGQWSRAEVRTDPVTGKPVFSVVKANGEYAMNLDFSLVCKKRRTLDAVFAQMISDGIMENFDMVESSIAAINDIIRDHGFETACALCFVDAKRYRQGIVADAFVSMYNGLVRSMIKDGQHADSFNFGGNSLVVNDGAGIDTLEDSDLDFTRINEVLKTENSQTVLYKIAKDLKENAEDRKLLMRGDFMSAKAFDTIKETNKRIMGLYNAKKGAGGPKASSLDVQYLNEILKPNSSNVKKAYAVGGVRIQSFSDYMPRLVFDYLQMVGDLAAKKLPAHAYTKEALFALQFGMTGIKINLSLVPEVVDGGIAPGLDKNGNYAWRDGQSFGSTVYGGSENFIRKCYEIIGKKYNGQDRLTAAEGFELAKAIQSAAGYDANCGTIAVGVSDEHIRKMLRDRDIRMVIPYHKSSLNHIVAVMTNIDRYTDYTDQQNTRRPGVDEKGNKKWVKLDKTQKDFNYNDALQKLGDAKAAADSYLEWCDQNGFLPKFDDFRNEDGYYKLLEDFTTYDSSGAAAPQHGVALTLPDSGSAFGSMKDMIQMGLEEDALLQGKQDEAVPEIVDEIKKTLPAFEAQQRTQSNRADQETAEQQNAEEYIQHSTRVTDPDTLKSLNAQLQRGEYDPVNNPNGGYIKVYRSAQIIDGGMYAPMNAVDRDENGKNRKLGYRSELKQWEMSTESPEIAQRYMDEHPGAPYAKFDLDGVDNKTGGVAYNPYIHMSNLVLNDQFSAAYRRKLVTVEYYVPVSEIGAYKAKYAKDGTGWVEWKPGGVAGKLMKLKPEYTRRLFVSRYAYPNRVMSEKEVAGMYKEYLDGTDLKVPWNVVTPELRRELVKAGVAIDYKDVYASTDKATGEKRYTRFADVFPDEAQVQYSSRGVDRQFQSEYSLRDTTEISSRELLDNTLESAVQSEAERDILRRYKEKVGKLNEIQAQLEEQRALMRDHISGVKKLPSAELVKARNRAELYAKQLDRADKTLLQLESMETVKAMMDREHKAYRKALKAEKRAEALRERYNEKLAAQIEESRERMENYRQKRRDTASRRKYRERIKRIANDFQQMLLHPTDSRYAPTALMQSCYDVAFMLDTSGEREDTKAKAQFNERMRRLADQYNALKNNNDSDYSLEYDADFAYMVDQLRQRLDGKAIRELSLNELEDVANVLSDINEMLKQAKYQIGKAEAITNYSVGERIIRQQQKHNAKTRSSGYRLAASVMRETGNVIRNVRRMTDYDNDAAIAQLVADLEDGVRRKNRFIMDANKEFDKFAGSRMRESATKIQTYHIGNKDVQMTEMQAMQVILSWEREAANNLTRHMIGGGIVIPDAALMEKGEGTEAIRVGNAVENLQQEDIMALMDTMDQWAQDYMDAARNFFNVTAKNAINDATMKTKHRMVATTPYYIPFEIDEGTVAKEIEGVKFDATIEGIGMLKSVQEGAANALIIRGLNTIIDRHIDRVSDVYGLAAPIKNYNKAMAVKLIGSNRVAKASIYTDDAKLLDQAVTDLQTTRSRDRGAVTKFFNKLQGAFVKATLLSNVSVTIKQAASYSTAGLYLSQQALAPYQTTIAQLFANNDSEFARKLFAEIDSHTATHYMRRKGMSLQEAAMIATDESTWVRWMDEHIKNDVINPLKWIQNMDVATTAALWLACKKQVELDGVKQSDGGYWDKVTEFYERVIADTQPMYDALHRPEIQKTTSDLTRSVLMFKTQPLQNAGIIWDAVGNYRNAKITGSGLKEAKKLLARAIGSQIASLAVFAAMSFLAYAVKNRLGRYKDDEDRLTVGSVAKTVLNDMASNAAGLLIPAIGSDIYTTVDGIVQRITTGKIPYDTFSVAVVDMLNGWITDVGNVVTDISKLGDGGEDKIGEDMLDIAMDVSAIFGIPAENVYNIFRGIIGNVTDIAGIPQDWATDAANTSKGMLNAWDNGHYDVALEKMEALIDEKVNNGKTLKEARAAVKSSMTTRFKPLYIKAFKAGNQKEMNRIRKIITQCGLYDNVSETLASWLK